MDWMSENPGILYGLGVQAVHVLQWVYKQYMFYSEVHLHMSITDTDSDISNVPPMSDFDNDFPSKMGCVSGTQPQAHLFLLRTEIFKNGSQTYSFIFNANSWAF